jgi:hypothetical protein
MALPVMGKPHRIRIANSIRLILAMFRLYADIETDFGKAALAVLKRAYPDQDIDADPAQVGHKMMNIARKQLQYNDQDAMDAIQEYLTYVSTGSQYETDESGQRIKFKVDEEGEPVLDDEGKPVPDPEGEYIDRVTPAPFDFAEGAATWKEALGNMYSNLRRKGITRSKKKIEKGQKERGIDEAYGRRTDDGAEGGEGRMPTDEESMLGTALDDASAIKEFYELIDKHIPELKDHLRGISPDVLALFELVFDEEVGGLGSDIKENMGQASAFKEKFPDVYQRFLDKWEGKVKKISLKWSSYVGDLRKKVIEGIWDYIDEYMAMDEFQALREEFFSDYDPSAQQRQIEKKEEEKASYQQMRDRNNIARLKAKLEKDGKLSDADQNKFDRIKKKLEGEGVDVEAIEADAAAGAKGKKEQKEKQKEQATATATSAAVVGMAFHLSSLPTKPLWAYSET